MAKVKLIGGAFQDAEGNVLANGYLTMQLSNDSRTDDGKQVASGIVIRIDLDANGNVDETPEQQVWPNDQLNPDDSYYTVYGYKSNGQVAWGPQYIQVTTPSPFDVGSWVPLAPGTLVPTVLGITLKTNSVNNGSQTLLNLIQSGGITITDAGNGNVTFAVLTPLALPAVWWPSTLTDAQVLLVYNVVNGMSFAADGAGSIATAEAAATAETVINIKKNGVTVGTITFAIGATTGVFDNDAWTAVATDQISLEVVTGDLTLSGIALTLKATRTS